MKNFMKEGCPFRYSQITQVGKIKLSRKSKLKTNHMEAWKGLTQKSLLSVVSLYGTVTCLASYFFLFQRTKMTAWTEVAGEKPYSWQKHTSLQLHKGIYMQQWNEELRDISCVYFFIFPVFIHFLFRIGSDHNRRIFKTTYLILVNLQAVAGSKKSCFRW